MPKYLAAIWAALACHAGVHAAPIEAIGVASLDKGMEYARQSAMKDARRQIALQRGALVISAERLTSRGDVLQSAAVRSAASAGQSFAVEEWKDGNYLHVLMRDEDTGDADSKYRVLYRKKVLITPFRVNRPNQVLDMDDVTFGMPRNLYERLARSERFQPRLGRYALPAEFAAYTGQPGYPGATPEQIAAAVRQLASDNDSQFVLTGELSDAGANTRNGAFSSTTTRSFEVRTALYDGLTGVLIAEHRIAQQGEGEVGIGRNRPFGSASFFSTPFGRVVDSVLGSIATETMKDLAPLPFTAKIVRIEGSKVIFDAGATSAVQPGDMLIAYGKKPEWDVGGALNGAGGIPESPLVTVSVQQVHPAFSIAELSGPSAQVRLRAGDYVRFVSSNQ